MLTNYSLNAERTVHFNKQCHATHLSTAEFYWWSSLLWDFFFFKSCHLSVASVYVPRVKYVPSTWAKWQTTLLLTCVQLCCLNTTKNFFFFSFLQVKMRRKLKSVDKDNGPASPMVPSITCDSVFDSGRELSSDVYSTVGTGTKTGKRKYCGYTTTFIKL